MAVLLWVLLMGVLGLGRYRNSGGLWHGSGAKAIALFPARVGEAPAKTQLRLGLRNKK